MERSKTQLLLMMLMGALTTACWAVLLWMASVVTETMMSVLRYILELAQLS